MTSAQRKAENRRRAASAARLRTALILALAPDLRCAKCGDQVADPSLLQVDHMNGKAWSARKLSPTARVARYRREHAIGIPLRALCGGCNSRDGWYRRFGLEAPGIPTDDEVPF